MPRVPYARFNAGSKDTLDRRERFRSLAQGSKDRERQEALRKQIFAVADTGAVDFDVLLDRVLSSFPEIWVTFTRRRGPPELGS